jgi:hypothetical protein
MDFKEIAFHAALKQACMEAGYKKLEVGPSFIRAEPSTRKLALVAKQFELVVHTIVFDNRSEKTSWDQISLGCPDDPDRQRITTVQSYDL